MTQSISISKVLHTSEFHWFILVYLIPFEIAWIQPSVTNTIAQIASISTSSSTGILPALLPHQGQKITRLCEGPIKDATSGSIECSFYLDNGEESQSLWCGVGWICLKMPRAIKKRTNFKISTEVVKVFILKIIVMLFMFRLKYLTI